MLVTQAQVRTRIQLLTDASSDPVLASGDIDTLVEQASRVDLFGNIPDTYTEWAPTTLRIPGDLVVPLGKRGDAAIPIIRNGFYYTCTTGGTSGTVEPNWPQVIGATVPDGTAVWTCGGVAPWNPTYDLYYAVSQGWLLKSTRLAGHYNFMSGGRMFSREQFFNHCMTLHKRYSAKAGVKSIRMGPHSPLSYSGHGVETNAD